MTVNVTSTSSFPPEVGEEYVVDDIEDDYEGYYDDEDEDDYDYDSMERKITKEFKLERRPKSTSHIPIRATKDNKKERIFPNRRIGHRKAAKLERKHVQKLLHVASRPTVFLGVVSTKSQEERDLEEALRRSRRQGNVTTNLSVATLLDFQNRELTPEDYELFFMLDETVEKKKVSKTAFSSFPQTILTADLPVDCAVCLCPMASGEKVTTLPCSHQYHTPCIEQWLTGSSPNCPLDGLSLLHDH